MAETAVTESHHDEQGYVKQRKRIWKVFWILAIVTTVEVALGINHPKFIAQSEIWHMSILTWIFVILTIVKAYYITWAFMHMEQEHVNLRRAVVWTIVFYIAYMVFILLAEGDYLHDVMHNDFIKWDY